MRLGATLSERNWMEVGRRTEPRHWVALCDRGSRRARCVECVDVDIKLGEGGIGEDSLPRLVDADELGCGEM